MEAVKQVVAAGPGLTIVSASTVKDQAAPDKPRMTPWQDFSIGRFLWQLRRPGRLETLAAQSFGKLLELSPSV